MAQLELDLSERAALTLVICKSLNSSFGDELSIDRGVNRLVIGLTRFSMIFNSLDLSMAEAILEDTPYPFRLIATPSEDFPMLNSVLPHSGDQTYPYALTVHTGGERGAQEWMRRRGLNPQDNLHNLKKTGIGIPKERT